MEGVGSSFEKSSLKSLTEKAAFGKNLKAMKPIQICWRKLFQWEQTAQQMQRLKKSMLAHVT